jgi:hypothetical protein
MIAKLLDVLFGCKHSNYTFPITIRPRPRRNSAASLTGTYVACLDCGRELPYDWEDMKIVSSVAAARHRVHELAPKQVG